MGWWRGVRARQDEAEALAVEATEAAFFAAMRADEPFDWKRHEKDLPSDAAIAKVIADELRKKKCLERYGWSES